MAPLTREKGLTTMSSVETQKLVVSQPSKLKELNSLLETFEGLNLRVSERTGEDRSGDMSGAGAGAGTGGAKRDDKKSARDQAIANIPVPVVMMEKLRAHIEKEIHELETQVHHAKRAATPGGAFELNNFYARIRRLRSLLAEIFEASVDLLKRLFIRVFVDDQSIL